MLRRLAPCLALGVVACGTAPLPADDTPPDARAPSDAVHPDAEAAGFQVTYTDPDHGPFGGGTEILVRGNGFADGDDVLVGGRLALLTVVQDDRHIQAYTPPGEPGLADVAVRHDGGDTATAANAFTYDALAIEPATGSTAGGTFVTITGLGTDFGPGTTVTLDGIPLTAVTIDSAEELTGYTPPGNVGDAELIVHTAANIYDVDRAYTYATTGDPFAGGMSGGPLAGTLDVVVLDTWTRNGIPGAYVAVGDPATSAHQGTTDALGQITFSGADLVGPIDVVATAPGFEVASFDCFDASHLTIWLRSPPPPPDPDNPGSIGPGDGMIHGTVQFGDVTGQGSPFWSLVPEPRTPTEVKRIYVSTSGATIFAPPPPPSDPIDYTYDPTVTAWPFEITAHPGAFSVVAVAGLYDPALDPSGNGVAGFQPFALGVTRGVLVGPEEEVDANVLVDIPLDAAAHVTFDDPPPLGTAGQLGPVDYDLKAFVDLGSDGAIAFGRHGLPLEVGQPAPGEYPLPLGASDIMIGGAPPRYSTIANASYTMVAAADTGGASPFSVRIERGMPGLGDVHIGDFLGTPHAVDPPRDGTASGRHLIFAPDGSPRAPTFHEQLLSTMDGVPVYRAITCGDRWDVELPDLSSVGYAWPPTQQQLVWTMWSIDVAGGLPYSSFTYRWLGGSYWSGYAADAVYVQFP